MHSIILALFFVAALGPPALANWFNESEEYLASCRDEAVKRYFKDTSSPDVRRHIYQCMLAHRYAFRTSCDETGWLDPSCYRLKFKTEGR
jgi:hypothetical protein